MNKHDFAVSAEYKEMIDIWNKVHDIIYEKNELFHDFITSLILIINETHLGFDIIKEERDIKNHFSWCFNKVISDFENERIFFKREGGHFDYLYLFFLSTFYKIENESNITELNKHFGNLFNFHKQKTVTELEVFTELYKLLDQNLKK